MMKKLDVLHGGVCLVKDASETTLDHFCRIVAATLEDHGHRVDNQRFVSENQVSIVSASYYVVINFDPDARLSRNAAESTPRVVYCLCPAHPEQVNVRESEWLMAAMLFRTIEAFGAEAVEWRSSRNRLPVDGFLEAFSTISKDRLRPQHEVITTLPRKSRRDRFAPIEETEERLADRADRMVGQQVKADIEGPATLSEEDALALAMRPDLPLEQEIQGEKGADLLRLATWGLTGALAFVSAPAGMAMATLNVVRGEDFRLNTHVLSVGLLFAVY